MPFYETTYSIRVLSEEPIPEHMELEDVLDEAETGDYVAYRGLGPQQQRTIDGAECAKLLYEYGSDPGFFNLNDDGSPIEES